MHPHCAFAKPRQVSEQAAKRPHGIAHGTQNESVVMSRQDIIAPRRKHLIRNIREDRSERGRGSAFIEGEFICTATYCERA